MVLPLGPARVVPGQKHLITVMLNIQAQGSIERTAARSALLVNLLTTTRPSQDMAAIPVMDSQIRHLDQTVSTDIRSSTRPAHDK